MRKEVKIGIGLCLVLGLVVVAYLTMHGQSKDGAAPAPSAPAPTVNRAPLPRPIPTGQAPRPGQPSQVQALRPGGPLTVDRLAEAPTSAPDSQPVAQAPNSLSPMEQALGHPAGMLPRAPAALTPIEPLAPSAQGPTAQAPRSPGAAQVANLVLNPRGAAPAPASPGMAAPGTYTVVSGDTLWSVARKQYGNPALWAKIRDANPGLHGDRLQIGQVLRIPSIDRGAPVAGAPAGPRPRMLPDGSTRTTPLAPGQRPYVVRVGDNPSVIAAREYGNPDLFPAILKANPGLDPRRMQPGQQIVLPSKAAAEAAVGSASAARNPTNNRSTLAARAPAPQRAPAAQAAGKPHFGSN